MLPAVRRGRRSLEQLDEDLACQGPGLERPVPGPSAPLRARDAQHLLVHAQPGLIASRHVAAGRPSEQLERSLVVGRGQRSLPCIPRRKVPIQ